MRFTTAEVADATGGEVFGRAGEVEGASIDSRSINAGQLFVPIVAERDGHQFIKAAIGRGASVYLTSGPIEAGTAVLVGDTGVALTDLGRAARSHITGPVVGITGSVGKTSAKDLLAAVASTTWRTAASVGSFNNELGVSLTLVNAPGQTEVAVVEMGARGKGHIGVLCEVARPTVGIVTVVAGAHLEQFGSLEGVAEAKSELVAGLPADGTAVLNADDPLVRAMADVTEATTVMFGVHGGDVRAEAVTLDDEVRARFTLVSPWGSIAVRLGVAGEHQVVNALAAAAAALSFGTPLDAVAAGLAQGRLSPGRMDLTTRSDGVRVLDDSYNANPTSMLAALDALTRIDATRRFAVVGTMAELGDGAAAAHRTIAVAAQARGITLVSVAEPRYDLDAGRTTGDPAAAVEALHRAGLADGDAVLVKASRSAGLERVVALLLAG